MDSRIEIDQITTISNTLEVDGTTTPCFHVQDEILKDMSSDQITNWIKKLNTTEMKDKFQLHDSLKP